MTYLSDKQVSVLLRPVNPSRVRSSQGQRHMEAYDIRAHLNRVFGFARWSADVVEMTLLFEREHENSKKKEAVSVGYRAGVRLVVAAEDGEVLASYTEYAAGAASGFPVAKRADAHDMAIKTAESQALKRAAINLGDQFGLSLYGPDPSRPLVGQSLVGARVEVESPDADAPEVVPDSSGFEDWLTLARDTTTREELKAVWEQAREAGVPPHVLDEIRSAGGS